MKLTRRHLLIGLTLVAALVLLYAKTAGRIIFAEHERFDSSCDRFLRADTLLNQDILKVRSQLLGDYDSFSARIDEMKVSLRNLTTVPSFVPQAEREAILHQLDDLSQFVAQKDALLDHFKSQNAVLNNSVRYVAVAGSELARRVAPDPADDELEEMVNDLMRQVLVYSLHPDESQTPHIRMSLERLKQWRAQHAGHRENAALASLARHMASIVSRQPEMDALTEELLLIPITERASSMLEAYQGRFEEELRTADFYQSVLHVVCVLLVLGIGYTIYALNAANAHLEARVDERTMDVSSKNEQLQAEITERESAQEALQKSEQRFTDMLRNLELVSVMFDRDARITYCNDHLLRLTGKQRGEVIGQNWFEHFAPPGRIAELKSVFSTLLANHPVAWNHQGEILTRAGAPRLIAWSNSILHSPSGEVIGTASIGEDITERHQAEKELLWKTALLEAQLNSSIDGILVVDQEGKQILRNQRLSDLFKIPKSIAAQEDDAEQVRWVTNTTRYPQQFIEKVVHLYSHPDEISRDEIELKDGATLDRYSSPVIGKDGKYYGRIWTFRDITEQKRLQRHQDAQSGTRIALAESLGLDVAAPKVLQIVCETLGWDLGGLWSLDRHSDLLRCVQTWSGTPEQTDEFISESRSMTLARGVGLPGRVWECGEPVWVEDLVADGNFIRTSATGRAGLHSAFAFPIFSGQEVVHVIEFFSREVRPPDPELLRLFANVGSQINQFIARRRLEDQLVDSQKMETVGRLAGGVAHEFNSIMTAIIGQSELLLGDLPEGEPPFQKAAEIRKAADRAASLTRQLLAYGRKQVLQPEFLDLSKTLAGMEHMICHIMGGDVKVRIVAGEGTRRVKADAAQIQQVVMNMVLNAREAMPRGGKLTVETSEVTVESDSVGRHPELKPGRHVMMAITDTGVGMSDEAKSRVFEPFFSTKDVGQGTGLGLATCYGIVKQSGGHITMYSEPGRGTTFKIYLPEAQGETAARPPSGSPASLPCGTETILLVEDDPALREMASSMLRRLGYNVFVAADGMTALDLAEQRSKESIDLLFTDVVMPQISGRELSDRILAERPQTRILFSSAYTENAIHHLNLLDSDVALLQKPFTPSALARKVREVLDQN